MLNVEDYDLGAGGLSPTALRGYEQSMRKLTKKAIIPGCASVVIRKGCITHSGTWGYADVESRTPFNFDTLCRTFCTTKGIISCALMRLVEREAVSLEDRLDKHLPEFASALVRVEGTERLVRAKTPIRLKHLIVHVSGLAYPPDIGEEVEGEDKEQLQKLQLAVQKGRITSLKAFVARLAQVPLAAHPGEKYIYGYSHDVLGRVIEVVMAKPLDRSLHELVFEPLGMTSTTFSASTDMVSRMSSCYCSAMTWGCMLGDSGEAVPSTPRPGLVRLDGCSMSDCHWADGAQCRVLSGGGFMGYLHGGLLSTVRDTTRFVMMLVRYGLNERGERVLQKKTVQEMERNRLTKAVGGSNKVCYLGNIGAFREGGPEVGMGGAACTWWSIDRIDDVATVWFAQHVDMPEFTDVDGVDSKKADLWEFLHNIVERTRTRHAQKRKRAPSAKAKQSLKKRRRTK